jgi:alkylation response protein AidB-like acyl-CoA dehydrogenase
MYVEFSPPDYPKTEMPQTAAPPAPILPTTPAAAVASAAQLAPQLFALAASTDTEGEFPTREFALLREAGLLTATLPATMGGADLHTLAATGPLLELLRHVGHGNLAVGRVYEGHLNALLLIQQFGSAAQVARAAAEARNGHLFGVWNTENPAQGVRLEVLPNGHYRLHGAKTFASGAGHISRPLITGALPDGQGWQLFVLNADTQPPVLDRSFWRPLGMRTSASFRAEVTGLALEPDDLIGAPNAYYRQPWFGGGAIRFAAVQLGGAEAVFDETRRFLQSLGRLDDPYQRQRLGEMAILLESGRHWLRGAAAQAAAHAPAEATVAYANMTRTAIEKICLEMLSLAERSVGARGLLQPEPFERLHRDLTHYLRQPAPDAALADVGRFVLEHQQAANEFWPLH